MGRIESGEIKVGDAVTVLPNGYASTVKAIQMGVEEIQSATTEQSVTLLLNDEIDTSRGDMIVKSDQMPEPVKQIDAMTRKDEYPPDTLVWDAKGEALKNRTVPAFEPKPGAAVRVKVY